VSPLAKPPLWAQAWAVVVLLLGPLQEPEQPLWVAAVQRVPGLLRHPLVPASGWLGQLR
jgi:hypothetical protein